MARVVFEPGGRCVEAEAGETLLQLSKKNGIGIKYSCDGAPSCVMCRVVVVAGDENLSPIERKEEDLIGTSYFITKNRLSCQARLTGSGEVRIDLTENQEVRGEKKKSQPYSAKSPGSRGAHGHSARPTAEKHKGERRQHSGAKKQREGRPASDPPSPA